MLGLALRNDHASGSFRLEVWRDEHGDISLCVHDEGGAAQFDFELSDDEADDLIFLLQRRRAVKEVT